MAGYRHVTVEATVTTESVRLRDPRSSRAMNEQLPLGHTWAVRTVLAG